MLGVSRRTLYRRLEEYNISPNDYTALSETELEEIVRYIKSSFPNDGEVMLNAHLLRMGIKVTRASLRAAIHNVDHENTILRRAHTIRRRVYAVSRPNTVWHVDGNHKLIRWKLVVHASVDGFSRVITFMKCSNNNRAETVLECFLDAISVLGCPLRVRTNNGGENVDIWRLMLFVNNYNPSSVITGSSVHNERVERMWRDVYRCVTSTYAAVFSEIESKGYLDPLNDVDIFCPSLSVPSNY